MTGRHGRGLWFLLVGGALQAACTGGQSGTEGGMREHCVCEFSWTPGRAVVAGIDGTAVTLEVESWLDEAYAPPPGLAPGDSFTARWAPGRDCGKDVALAAGDLVLFDAPSAGRAGCASFLECGEQACGEQPAPSPAPEGDDVGSTPLDDWHECANTACAEERALCAQDYSSSWLRLAQWSPESEMWNFGVGTEGPWTAADDGIGELLDSEECDSVFPYDPGCDTFVNGRWDCD